MGTRRAIGTIATGEPNPRDVAPGAKRFHSRRMVRLICALAAFVAFGGAASAQAPAPLPFTLKQVGPGIYAAIDGPEHKAGSNAGFVIGDEGVLVVDAFFTNEASKALVGEIHRLTPKPI